MIFVVIIQTNLRIVFNYEVNSPTYIFDKYIIVNIMLGNGFFSLRTGSDHSPPRWPKRGFREYSEELLNVQGFKETRSKL